MSLAYAVQEGIAGFRRAPFAAFASTSAMVVALVLTGVFSFLIYEFQVAVTYLRQRVGELEIYLENVDDATARALTARAAATRGVDDVQYISKEEAYRIFEEDFGEEARLFQDEDFLPASIRVRVEGDYANLDSLESLKRSFESWNRVDEVVFDAALLARVQKNLRLITLGGLGLGAFVVLAALFLVANTIRLTIYARRLLIRTMKLVGATDRFIRRPFVVEGLLQGVIAGLIAGAILWGLYGLMLEALPIPRTDSPLVTLIPSIAAVLLGLFLGWLGSLLAVTRFIKRVALH